MTSSWFCVVLLGIMEGVPVLLAILQILLACHYVSGLDNGLGKVPAMGWNTWCTLGKCGRDFCNAQEIMEVADAMSTNGMKELGYEYINLDDCWANSRDSKGNIMPDPSRFPNGMKPVVDYVKSKGFKFGLYTDAGLYTCSQGERDHKIPGSYSHYEQDAQTYADWGVEYVKMDWCNTEVNGTKLDPKVQYPQMSRALLATKKPIFFNACEWGVEDPWEWMAQYANSWRSGPDHHDDWESTSKIIEINADKGKYAGPGGWNDADFLMTGGQGCSNDAPMIHCPGMTDTEYKTEFTMWCIMASSLIVSTDVRNMTSIMKEVLLNKELIAVNQDSLGKAGGRLSSGEDLCSHCEVWAKQLSMGYMAVALYNSGEEASQISVNLGMFNMTGSAVFYDYWTKMSTTVTNSFSVVVDSHEAKAYEVRPTTF